MCLSPRAASCISAWRRWRLLALPVGLPETWREPPLGDPYLWQLGLFAVAVGLPFVAVAANAPLLQAWFSRSGHPHAQDPYFLYGASNLGSLIALLGYPFLFEPAFGLTALSRYWALLYVVLIVAIGACFALVRRRAEARHAAAAASTPADADAPTWRRRIAWCGLALVPAALLTAFTTHIATDIASAPLLWVLPLALYLSTFVLAFQSRLPLPMWLLLPAQLAAVLFALLELAQTKHDKWVLTAGAGVAAFFLAALVAHRTLYLNRPQARYLTEFYLWMSFGGVLGGLFSALIAPRIFTEVFEYPLLIALSLACRPGVFDQPGSAKTDVMWILGTFAAGLLLIWQGPILAAQYGYSFGEWGTTPAIALVFALAAVAFWSHGARQLTAALMVFAVVVMLPSSVKRGHAQRSYYGVYRVSQSEGGDFNVLTHGTTLHGAQRLARSDRPHRLRRHARHLLLPGLAHGGGGEDRAGAPRRRRRAGPLRHRRPRRRLARLLLAQARGVALLRDRSDRRRHRREVEALHLPRQLPAAARRRHRRRAPDARQGAGQDRSTSSSSTPSPPTPCPCT